MLCAVVLSGGVAQAWMAKTEAQRQAIIAQPIHAKLEAIEAICPITLVLAARRGDVGEMCDEMGKGRNVNGYSDDGVSGLPLKHMLCYLSVFKFVFLS